MPMDDARGQSWDEICTTLTRAVRAICPSWAESVRQDVVQEASLAVWKHLQRGEGEKSFSSSYLRKVAYHAVVDEVRRRNARAASPLDVEAPGLTSPEPGPERRSRAVEIARAIRECLTHLVKARRRAVTLQLLGHRVPEIANLMGWTRKQAENLVLRGRAQLRSCLEGKGMRP